MTYLDNAATTPTDRRVVDKMKKYFNKNYGNPSSSHSLGQESKKALNRARKKLSDFLNCQPEEIIFTSGATEANNLALKGLVKNIKEKENQKNSRQKRKAKIHIITSQIEHSCVLKTAQNLEKNEVEVEYIKPDKNGYISADKLKKAVKPSTRLVSIMLANNEIGSIQPIKEMGKMIEKINKKRSKEEKKKKQKTRQERIYFHTDAVQAIQYLNCNPRYLHVDLLSLSAHKFFGPKGIGALYKAKNTPLSPIIQGGGQEKGLRSGTENVPGIVGLGKAVSLINRKEGCEKTKKVRDYFEKKAEKEIENIKINGKKTKRLPHISSIVFKEAEGESILISLDMEGIYVSTGSACASKNLKASHVLTSIGLTKKEAQSVIRFSFSKNNSKKEADKTIEVLKKTLKKLRKMSPK